MISFWYFCVFKSNKNFFINNTDKNGLKKTRRKKLKSFSFLFSLSFFQQFLFFRYCFSILYSVFFSFLYSFSSLFPFSLPVSSSFLSSHRFRQFFHYFLIIPFFSFCLLLRCCFYFNFLFFIFCFCFAFSHFCVSYF